MRPSTLAHSSKARAPGLKWLLINLLRTGSFPKGQIQIGSYTSGTPTILSYVKTDRVTIGKFCSIAVDVMLIPSYGHLPSEGQKGYRICLYALSALRKSIAADRYSSLGKPNRIVIGNDVWLGARSIILSDIKIGDGAVVGAGSIVTHDVPPYAVVAGNPAKVLKYRYDKEQIRKLLEIAWWEWPIEKILANVDSFYGRIDDFIEKFWKERSQ